MITSFLTLLDLRLQLMSMTLKQNDSHCYGRVLIHQISEKHKCTQSGNSLPFLFDYSPIVHHEFVPADHSFNQSYDLEIMRHVRDGV